MTDSDKEEKEEEPSLEAQATFDKASLSSGDSEESNDSDEDDE